MAELDGPRITRRLETIEQRLAKIERFSSVITSTEELTLFRDSGKVAARLGKVSSTGRTALEINSTDGTTVEFRAGKLASNSGHGVEVRSADGNYVKLSNFVTPKIPIETVSPTNVSTGAAYSFSTSAKTTVTIGPSRLAVVSYGAEVRVDANEQGFVSFKSTGASSKVASDTDAATLTAAGAVTASISRAATFILGSTGSHTFTLAYRAVGGTVAFNNGYLWVWPI